MWRYETQLSDNNQLLLIDGHSWSKIFCSIFFLKNPWNFMPFTYHESTTIRTAAIRHQRFSPSPLSGDTGPAKRVTHGAFSKVLKFSICRKKLFSKRPETQKLGFSAGNKHFGASRSFLYSRTVSVDGKGKQQKRSVLKKLRLNSWKVSVVFSYDSPGFFTVEPFVDGGFRDHL